MFTPVFKSADPDFNYHAADLASKLVMAMDEDEARMFTTCVVTDILWDDIEKNQRSLQRHLNSVVSKRLKMVAKAADRVVSKRDGSEFGAALVDISKATRNPYDFGYVFNESDYNRDPGSGQFRSKVKYTASKPVPNKIARSTPNLPSPDKTKHLSAAEKARYQQGYQQIASFLDTMRQSGIAGDAKTYVTVHDTAENRTYVKEVSGTDVPTIDPKTEAFVGIEARPTALNVGGASFGLVSALGGGAHRAGQVGATAQAVDDNTRSFATDWTSAGVDNPLSSNARLYGRVEAGSRFLGQVAPAGSKLHMAATFGEFVGRQGPQAERVLGPRARTTMYRYRGTEKTPDSDLTGPYNRQRTGGYAIENLNQQNQAKIRQLQRSAVTRYKNAHGGKISTKEAEEVRQNVLRRSFGVSDKDARMGAEGGKIRAFQAAQAFMMSKVPTGKLYDLQLKSGHTPPSEGVIIDKDGKIVTQAIGYGDDHYLPFNLKNLKGLRGGEYIRTRSVGGPTTEDIYTGLVSGAHRLTVVSRSGTFTITFDDTFRGTRRYNDKAGRMVDRYGKILDAIKSEQVERQPLDPTVRAKIANDVDTEMGWAPAREQRNEIKRREAEYKENPYLTDEDEAQIERVVQRHGGSDADKQRTRAELRNQALEDKAYNFRLNGDGYAAGIKALEEQFPYYIADATHRPTREGRYEGAGDRGYVKPRFNRPSEALDGYFDTSITGEGTYSNARGEKTGKNRADRMDYQNSRGRLTRVDATERAPGEETPKEEPRAQVAQTEVPTPAEVMADRIETAQARQTLTDRALELQQAVAARTVAAGGDPGPLKDFVGLSPEEFRSWYASPANQAAFHRQVEATIRPNMDRLGVKDQLTNYGAARGLAGGEKFNRANHMSTVPDQPYSFEGAPYMRGGNADKKERELQRIAARTKVPDFGSLAEMEHDEDFKEALGAAQKLRVISDQLAQYPPDENGSRNSYLMALAQNDETVAAMSPEEKRLLTEPGKVDQMVEDINRAWALRKLIGPKTTLTTSAGRLEPTGQTIATPSPTPQQRAVESVATPSSNRRAARSYREALSTYAQRIADINPQAGEALNDVASQFDIAQHTPEHSVQREFNAAQAALMDLTTEYPQFKKGIEEDIMRRLHEDNQ